MTHPRIRLFGPRTPRWFRPNRRKVSQTERFHAARHTVHAVHTVHTVQKMRGFLAGETSEAKPGRGLVRVLRLARPGQKVAAEQIPRPNRLKVRPAAPICDPQQNDPRRARRIPMNAGAAVVAKARAASLRWPKARGQHIDRPSRPNPRSRHGCRSPFYRPSRRFRPQRRPNPPRKTKTTESKNMYRR